VTAPPWWHKGARVAAERTTALFMWKAGTRRSGVDSPIETEGEGPPGRALRCRSFSPGRQHPPRKAFCLMTAPPARSGSPQMDNGQRLDNATRQPSTLRQPGMRSTRLESAKGPRAHLPWSLDRQSVAAWLLTNCREALLVKKGKEPWCKPHITGSTGLPVHRQPIPIFTPAVFLASVKHIKSGRYPPRYAVVPNIG
jgi:hypothetical protein